MDSCQKSPDNYLSNIINFLQILRKSGINIGLQETLDVFCILPSIDISSRISVKYALSCCLAKTRQEKQIFAEAFDLYFVNAGSRRSYMEQKISESAQAIQKITNDAKDLEFQGIPLEIPQKLKEIYSSMDAEQKEGIKEFLKRTSEGKNVRQEFMPLVGNMVKNRLKNIESGSISENTSYIPQDLWDEAGIISFEIDERIRQQNSLIYKNLAGIKDEEIPLMVQLIKRMSKVLRMRLGKKYKKSGRKKKLDMRRTLRSNFSTGEVLFRLKFRKKSPRKRKYLLFCDVSGSMFRYSSFVIQFVIEMEKSLSSVQCNIFSEFCAQIDVKTGNTCREFEERIKASPLWRRGTDIGSSLACLLQSSRTSVGSASILIIVSDGKTVNPSLAKTMLSKLSDRVRKIIWLNPLPEDKWTAIPEIAAYRKFSEMLDCSTLERLGKACTAI